MLEELELNNLIIDWEKAIEHRNYKSILYLVQTELNELYKEMEEPNKTILDLINKIEIRLLLGFVPHKGVMKEWIDEGIVHNIPRTLEWINLDLKEVQDSIKSNRLNELIIKIDHVIKLTK